MDRRTLLKSVAVVAAAPLIAPGVNRGSFQLFAQSTTHYSARAVDLDGGKHPEVRLLHK